jgi:hypothetical protein
MTLHDVLECRDRVIDTWVDGIGRELDGLRLRNDVELLRSAKILLWRKDLWLASQSGYDVFVGEPVGNVEETPPQIWIFEDEWTVPGHSWTRLTEVNPELRPLTGVLFYPTTGRRSRASEVALLPFSWTRGPAPRSGRVHLWGAGNARFGEALDDLMAPLAAGIRFLDQGFVGEEPEPIPRHLRRAGQLGRRAPLTEISRVVLRKRTTDEEGGHTGKTCADWSCCSLVSPFWRRQWYPSLQKHLPRYVGPFVRGDTSKPLRSKKGLVYDVTR